MKNKNTAAALIGLSVGYFLAQPAHALSGPDSIEIDGGPFGSIQVSGGVDGMGYYYTGAGNKVNAGLVGDKSNGAQVSNYLFTVQKTTGVLQATVSVGATGYYSLGTTPIAATSGYLSPLYEGYVSIVPNANFTFSAGEIPSQEGYEALPDWSNANSLASLLYYTENTVSRGFLVTYDNTAGTINATVEFGDGYRTGVFNYLQFLAGYTFANSSYIDVYGGLNLGRSGPNTVGAYGAILPYNAGEYNSSMIGAYYGGYTLGANLSLVPEVQFQYTKADSLLGIAKESQNLGFLLLADYSFGVTPYSIGGFVEYATSQGPSQTWYIGPDASAVGVSVAPTWQFKNLFARADLGYIYLTNNKADGVSYGYGANGNQKGQFTGVLEAGALF